MPTAKRILGDVPQPRPKVLPQKRRADFKLGDAPKKRRLLRLTAISTDPFA